MAIFVQFAIGLLFGLGLVVSGMSNPATVLGFLDFAAIGAGSWDPRLAFVLAGAVGVAALGYRVVLARKQPVLADTFHLPTATSVDARLVAGAAIFGVGWGLVGFCPGPAFVALGTGAWPAFLFVAAMLAGMAAARELARRFSPNRRAPAASGA
ncbi:MAG: YeeE/YedE family protein [Telmatospirillum sp.]|nr:YeeE/YedE family protein [Telmatospirillum sp.]